MRLYTGSEEVIVLSVKMTMQKMITLLVPALIPVQVNLPVASSQSRPKTLVHQRHQKRRRHRDLHNVTKVEVRHIAT